MGSSADAFLGTQGDPWDTQEDMCMAGIGAISAFLMMPRIHDKAIARRMRRRCDSENGLR
jgi:putative membrane protein